MRRVYTLQPFWMIHMVLGYFLEFGASAQLVIAYLDRTKWCTWFGHRIAHAGSFKFQKNAFLNDPDSQKTRFWAIFFSWAHRIALILHILIEINSVRDTVTVRLILDHSKCTKITFCMIQIAQNEFLYHFLEFGGLDLLDIAYYHSPKCYWQCGHSFKK